MDCDFLLSQALKRNTETTEKNTRRDLVFWIAGAVSDYGPGANVLKPSITRLNYRGEETLAVERWQ